MRRDVAIAGAGLMGACTALALAARGIGSTLIERDPLPMDRASRRNEGKIHLGLIYAGEPGRATALWQLEGALTFAPPAAPAGRGHGPGPGGAALRLPRPP